MTAATTRSLVRAPDTDELIADVCEELTVEAAVILVRVVNCRPWAEPTPRNLVRMLAGLQAIPRQGSDSLWQQTLADR